MFGNLKSTLDSDYPKVVFKCRSETSKMPKKATPYAAAYDLYSDETVTILPGEFCKVETNVTVDMKNNKLLYGRIAGRSGLAAKDGILIGGGVVDSDYQGTLGVLMFNMGKKEKAIEQGDRIAQFIFERKAFPLVDHEDYMKETRGESGFGSTGKQD